MAARTQEQTVEQTVEQEEELKPVEYNVKDMLSTHSNFAGWLQIIYNPQLDQSRLISKKAISAATELIAYLKKFEKDGGLLELNKVRSANIPDAISFDKLIKLAQTVLDANEKINEYTRLKYGEAKPTEDKTYDFSGFVMTPKIETPEELS